ncbi:hypothetical protein ACFLZ7_02925 [Nanoarchaeota archaeon]
MPDWSENMFNDDRTIAEIEQDNYEPYILEQYERRSIDEIRRGIENHDYVDIRIIKDHLEFLEHLIFKIEHIRNQERAGDNITKELDQDLAEINKVKQELAHILSLNA